ncbi:uncharacterized protein [Parasteatoda tepidariorum]|uniref:uncharacterized protein n=1 Tax=Parasteatoda tepidariorum TaxID=114398 RepID=UPI0039BD73AC
MDKDKVLILENNVDDSEQNLVNDHMDKDKILPSENNIDNMNSQKVNKFSCAHCVQTFSKNSNLRRHERNVHSINNATCNQVCGLCSLKTRTIIDLHNHIKTEHPEIKLTFHDKVFFCQSDFDQWKSDIEQQTVSSFILKNSLLKENSETRYYRCHRSGIYKPCEIERKRRSKYTGSIKTSITCPAMITATKETVHEATQITVQYQSTHAGHKCEVGKLPLQKEDRATLANMLGVGIPISVVMDKIQAKFSPTKRLGLTTRQDIYNVAQGFNVSNIMHNDDAMAVDITVKKMMQEESNPVLIYKPIGEKLNQYPGIEEEEFLLGIATESQIELMDFYGKECIMLDDTHGTNQYGFHLTTILVHDENHEGLPVAIFFSKRIASESLEPFFDAIKQRLSSFVTRVMMTDDTTTFLNAWVKSFKNEPRHLLCSWHVMKSLNKNLNSKVKNEVVRENMKKDMKLIIHELDEITFSKLAENFFVQYKEEEAFLSYFQEYYMSRAEKWAYCFRKGLKINTNMKLERWHRQIKYEESGGVVMKRLDKSLQTVMKAMAKKLINRVIAIERGKLTNRVKLIMKRHLESTKMDASMYSAMQMNEGQYIVSKEEDGKIFTYEVEKESSSCSCTTACIDCNICIHTMSCSCVDFSIRYVICKHIHFVCQKFKNVCKKVEEDICPSTSEENMLVIDDDEISKNTEKNIILKQMNKKPRKDMNEKKLAIEQYCKDISSDAQSIQSFENLQQIEDGLKNIRALMQAFNNSELPTSEEWKAIPSNKKIYPQRKFKIPKRKQQQKK